jgi:hypothetical protein
MCQKASRKSYVHAKNGYLRIATPFKTSKLKLIKSSLNRRLWVKVSEN